MKLIDQSWMIWNSPDNDSKYDYYIMRYYSNAYYIWRWLPERLEVRVTMRVDRYERERTLRIPPAIKCILKIKYP